MVLEKGDAMKLSKKSKFLAFTGIASLTLFGLYQNATVGYPSAPASISNETVNRIYRSYNSVDHFYSANSSEGTKLNYKLEGVGFFAYASKFNSNIIPLYRCDKSGNRFLSANQKCDGEKLEATIGFVSKIAGKGLIPLYLFDRGQNRKFASTNQQDGTKYKSLGILGYVPLVADVSKYGAKGDGVTDDTAALQSALEFIYGKGGGIVLVNKGTYLLKSGLVISANTILKAVGEVRYLRGRAGGAMLYNADPTDKKMNGYNGNGNIVIDGGIWDANIENGFYGNQNVFTLGYANGFTIKNVTFLDVVYGHAIDLSSSINVLIENSKFLGFSDNTNGGRYYAEAIQLDQNQKATTKKDANGKTVNVAASISIGLPDGTPNVNVTIRNCFFGSNPDNNDPRFGAWPAGVGSHGYPEKGPVQNIVVENNTFEELSYAGVHLYKWGDTKIINNKFRYSPLKRMFILNQEPMGTLTKSNNVEF